VDIFPTVLALLELEPPKGLDGVALFRKGSEEEIPRTYVFGETQVPYAVYFIRSKQAKYATGDPGKSSLRQRLEEFLKDTG
jgi:arylsulfatase A-like enzyme